MPTDRVFRYSISGGIYLISCIIIFYFLGLLNVERLISNPDGLFTLIGFLISTPVIGLMISVISYGVLYYLWDYDIIYFVPQDKKIVDRILCKVKLSESDKKSLESVFKHEKIYWTKETKRIFYPYYQLVVKSLIRDEEVYNFLERRWSTFWTLSNSIAAVSISLVTAAFVSMEYHKHLKVVFSPTSLFFIGLQILFVIMAFKAMFRAREESKRVEHLALLNI